MSALDEHFLSCNKLIQRRAEIHGQNWDDPFVKSFLKIRHIKIRYDYPRKRGCCIQQPQRFPSLLF